MFAEDLTVFFDAGEFAVRATWDAYSANVLFDSPSEDLLGGRAIGTAFEILLRASDFPAITRGESVMVLPDPVTGIAVAGAASTITLAATASAIDSAYNGMVMTITSGTGAGSTGTVSGYVGATKVATVSAPWAVAPGASSTYSIQGPGAEYTVREVRLEDDGALKRIRLGTQE